jgi:hypothetical protein
MLPSLRDADITWEAPGAPVRSGAIHERGTAEIVVVGKQPAAYTAVATVENGDAENHGNPLTTLLVARST